VNQAASRTLTFAWLRNVIFQKTGFFKAITFGTQNLQEKYDIDNDCEYSSNVSCIDLNVFEAFVAFEWLNEGE
jgi:hypothetical protein